MPNVPVSKTSDLPASRPRDVYSALRDEMDRVFERFDRGWPTLPTFFGRSTELMPSFDVRDDGKSITVEAELPGVEEKDVKVTLTGGVLTIKGEKKQEREEKKENYYLSERSFGSFERSLRLPDTIDDSKVEARFDKGVLKVVAQKRPEAVKTERTIEIKKS
ncbi:MAG: Hsp20/alpha crystallin family protein [Hyphomicrobiaceae bacterium]|nr:MAG: Hsp20/alpha crystallin family protein [Hyphomicrobiaceae bacterium]